MTAKHYVVVDGSNLATEGRRLPSLAQLDEAVRAYVHEDPDAEVVVVVDASFEHRIDPAEAAQLEQAELHGELVSPPAGAIGRGDAFVLRIAERTGAVVLSNDSFQEFHGEHPWLFDEGRLIGGKPVPGVGWIFTPRTPVRGPKSRRATENAKGQAGRVSAEVGAAEKAAELAKAAKRVARRGVARNGDGSRPRVGDVWVGPARPEPEPVAEVPTSADAAAKAASRGAAGAGPEPAAKAKGAAKATKATKATKAGPAKATKATKAGPAKATKATKATKAKATKATVKKAAKATKAKATEPAKKKAPAKVKAADAAKAAKAPKAEKALKAPKAPAKAVNAEKASGGAVAREPAAPAVSSRKMRAAIVDATVEAMLPPPGPPTASAGDGKAKGKGRTKDGGKSAKKDTAKKDTAKKDAAKKDAGKKDAAKKDKGHHGHAAGSKREAAEAEEAAADARSRGRRRRGAARPLPAVNEPLAFINFVAAFPMGGTLEGEVASYTSHGAMVEVEVPGGGVVHCYIPLSGLGDPPPTKARDVLARGERRSFVLVALDPARRVADLALPALAAAAGGRSDRGAV